MQFFRAHTKQSTIGSKSLWSCISSWINLHSSNWWLNPIKRVKWYFTKKYSNTTSLRFWPHVVRKFSQPKGVWKMSGAERIYMRKYYCMQVFAFNKSWWCESGSYNLFLTSKNEFSNSPILQNSNLKCCKMSLK